MESSVTTTTTTTTTRPLELLKELQQFVIEKTETVERLQKEIQEISIERDNLKNQVDSLKRQNKVLKQLTEGTARTEMTKYNNISTCSTIQNSTKYDILLEVNNSPKFKSNIKASTDSGLDMTSHDIVHDFTMTSDMTSERTDITSRVTESHGESTSYEIVDEKRDVNIMSTDIPIIKTPSTKRGLQKSSARRHRRSDSANVYELSADLKAMALGCLENKYGGKELSNKAARIIQQYYRHWVLNRSFLRMRTLSGRRRSMTMPEKHFEKLKQSTLVFYGPENPVMIVDDGNLTDTEKTVTIPIDESHEQSRDHDMLKRTETLIDTAVKLYPEHQDSVSTDSADSDHIDQDEVDHGSVDDFQTVNVPNDSESVPEEEKLPTSTPEAHEKRTLQKQSSQTSSNGSSSQYDIIEDSQVLTVVGRHIDLVDGTSFVVDKIHDHDSHDGMAFSKSATNDGDNEFDSTFDKSMHKRQFRIGVNLFNWKPEVGIQYLIDNGHLQNDVKSIADFFRKNTTISKQKISEYFGSLRNSFNMKVLLEFAKSFDYVGKEVDEALRQFQSYFKLTGEAQTVEKFLQVFSERYVECNPGKISDDPDIILLLAFALAMLNTDLHNQNVKRRMTVEEFIKNLRGADNGNDLDPEILKSMYNRIQKNEFATGADHTTQVHQIESSFIGKVPNLSASHRQFVKLFQVEEVYDPKRKEKQHNRLAFLFNDLLILAKPRGKSGIHGHTTGHMFTCKASYSLLGKKVAEFSNDFYPFGVCLLGKLDHKAVASFNTKDEKTRRSLVSELDEYIRETNGMENIRIALSKVNQLSWHNKRRKEERTKSLLLQDGERSPTNLLETPDTSSLQDLRQDLLNPNDVKKTAMSSSMGDITETEAEDLPPEALVRSGSTYSLDPVLLSATVSPLPFAKRHRSSFMSTIREAVSHSPHSIRRKGASLNRFDTNTRKEHRRSMPVLSPTPTHKF